MLIQTQVNTHINFMYINVCLGYRELGPSESGWPHVELGVNPSPNQIEVTFKT